MTPDPIILKSGRELRVSLAPFSDGTKLMKAVARELSAVNMADFGSLSDLSGKDINVLKNAFFQIMQSDAVEAAMMVCAGRAMYNGHRITPKLFEDDESARPDYLPIAWEVIKANLSPFFAGLDLPSLIRAMTPSAGTPKSE